MMIELFADVLSVVSILCAVIGGSLAILSEIKKGDTRLLSRAWAFLILAGTFCILGWLIKSIAMAVA